MNSASAPATPLSSAAVVVLSARSSAALQDKAAQLLKVIRSGRFADADLPDIAYTLQVGREAMDERLALLAESLDEVAQKLQAWLDGGGAETDGF